jgi:hypothetical protein
MLAHTLYHGTTSTNLAAILGDGISSPSWWGTEAIAIYYAEVASEEDDGQPVIIAVPLARFDIDKLVPDEGAVAEPITTVLGASDDTLYEQWEQCVGSWQDCLCIYGSVKYIGGAVRVDRADITQLPEKPKE